MLTRDELRTAVLNGFDRALTMPGLRLLISRQGRNIVYGLQAYFRGLPDTEMGKLLALVPQTLEGEPQMAEQHPAKTLFADRVIYYPEPRSTRTGPVSDPHVAFVIKTHDDDPHMACLVYYCPVTHGWKEAYNVPFGNRDDGKAYFTNPEG